MDATQHIIVAPNQKSKPKFNSVLEIPAELLSRDQWRQKGRSIKKAAVYRATLEVVENNDASGSVYISDKLYTVEDTSPIRKAKTDPWLEAYWSHFVADHNQGGYIRWSDRDGEWKTISPDTPATKWTAPYLRKGDVQAHVAEREIKGVFGGEYSNWLAVDVDCHKPTPDLQSLFVDQLTALLNSFSQRAVQVADEAAKGVHILLIYPHGPLDVYRHQVRQYLHHLDQQHPELAERAQLLDSKHEDGTRCLKVKTLGELEIYPDPANGFRLPLARGRTMLLDRPLERRLNRQQRPVHDLAAFMTWVQDPARQCMGTEAIIGHVRQRLKQPVSATPAIMPASSSSSTTITRTASVTSTTPTRLKGCYRQTMLAYWRSELAVPNSLDAMLLASARILPFEVDEEEACSVLVDLVEGLTDLTVSTRLLNGDEKGVYRAVKHAVKVVYHDDPSVENEKMVAVAAAFRRRDFRLSDRTTWETSDFSWTAEELGVIEREFVPMFPLAENGVVGAAPAHFIKYMKGKTGGEVARDMWALPFSRYPGMNLGKHAKKTALKKKLLDLGWLVVVTQPYKPRDGRKGRATGYAVGPALKNKFSRTNSGEEELPERAHELVLEAAQLL